MSRFRLTVKDHEGQARILLMDGQTVVGMVNLSWHAHEQLVRAVAKGLIDVARESIARTLAARLWQDAQSISEDSTDRAMRKLAELGFTQEKIEAYAEEMARKLAEDMMEKLP